MLLSNKILLATGIEGNVMVHKNNHSIISNVFATTIGMFIYKIHAKILNLEKKWGSQ